MKYVSAFTILLATASIPLLAAPIAGGACGEGLFSEYIALGHTGCTAKNFLWRDFSFSGTLDGVPIDPASLTVTFNPPIAEWAFGWYAYANQVIGLNKVLVLDFGYGVAGRQSTIYAGASVRFPKVFSTQSSQACKDGYFVGGICSGTLQVGRQQYDNPPLH